MIARSASGKGVAKTCAGRKNEAGLVGSCGRRQRGYFFLLAPHLGPASSTPSIRFECFRPGRGGRVTSRRILQLVWVAAPLSHLTRIDCLYHPSVTKHGPDGSCLDPPGPDTSKSVRSPCAPSAGCGGGLTRPPAGPDAPAQMPADKPTTAAG